MPRRFDVKTSATYPSEQGPRTGWCRIGMATEIDDGKILVRLFAQPIVNDGQTIRLALFPRSPQERDED